MRLRKMDAAGDMVFGGGQLAFFVDSSEGVAQLIGTRLRLLTGEWFLDTTAGVPWLTDVIGVRTSGTRDAAVRQCILGTTGVKSITAYASSVTDRAFRAQVVVETAYGALALQMFAAASIGGDGLDFSLVPASQYLPGI